MSVRIRVCIDVDDLGKAIEFYTGGLGLELGRTFGPNWAEILGASSPIDLLVKPAGTAANPVSAAKRDYTRHWTPVHLDFVVEDLEAAVRRAERAGARLDREIQVEKWGRMANMADPFGHGICLLEFRGRGYDELIEG
jgi:predicted enzyme related to lactoylglutathione lyase